MKKTIIIATIIMTILTGCSNAKSDADTTNKQSANDGAVEQIQDKTQAEDNEDTSNNTNSDEIKSGDNKKIKLDKGYHDYEGDINNNLKIHMSLYPSEDQIVGGYFYDNERKELQLKGKLEGSVITLSEYDENGTNTGEFQGTMDANEKVEGTWTSADGKKSYPFTLTLSSIINGSTYGKRYAIALSDSRTDQDVENFINDIQNYIKNDNREQLADSVSYPIKVKINNNYTEIQNKDEFIKNYDKIFYPQYKEAMSTAYTKYLFVNSKGIMFGGNIQNMWINDVIFNDGSSKLSITSIIN